MNFEQAITEQIVRQYFTGYTLTDQFGNTREVYAPVARLANQLLKHNEGSIIVDITKKLDLDAIAKGITVSIGDHLTSTDYRAKKEQDDIKKMVYEKYAELKALEMIDAEKARDGQQQN